MPYLVVCTKDSNSAVAIYTSVKGSMVLSKDGMFYVILGKLGEKDLKVDGVFQNFSGVCVMSKDTLIP